MRILLALLIVFGVIGAARSEVDEFIRFEAWGQEINVRITSPANVYKWCVRILRLPQNTIGCTHWVKGSKDRCFVLISYRAPPWLVFHELLNRCRDRSTKPFPLRKRG